MNGKKLAFISVIALVVVGCVLAAGCTDQTGNDTIVGTWDLDFAKIADVTEKASTVFPEVKDQIVHSGATMADLKTLITVKAVFDKDGKGKLVYYARGTTAAEEPLTWKKASGDTFALNILGSDTQFKFDAAKGTLTDDAGIFVMKKQA